MTFNAEAVLVLVASPSDTVEERGSVAAELNRWNAARSQRERVCLVPWLYERNAVPLMGGSPQSIINAQAVDRADVVVAIFDTRLGTRTAAAVSGTAEEIDRAVEAGKRVHVYFSSEDIKRESFDADQFKALDKFRRSLEPRGLLGRYDSPEHLAQLVRDALEHDIVEMDWGSGRQALPAPPGGAPGAQLVAHHEYERELKGYDRRGRPQYRTKRNRLVVRNESATQSAEDVAIAVTALDDLDVHFEGPADPFTLPPKSERNWRMIPAGTGSVQLDYSWTENGEPCTSTQTISVPGAA